ncbi:YihY/virulence factor BrkB family protein [Haloprofundus sp. MHR1]|uniref:YihY/virulence factor BrkB family protein n=1 Tax=Haloprofundus sp. MHR1 TaxID=2572921 RepID=UPI0010BF29CA|nr:YihY/virulence factor BrkB family protein [Haloprofundus sp. MHR1]QCJ45870.1 YihY/virulence factor BrkB family protein [Haloprofundus sp. MHR1]
MGGLARVLDVTVAVARAAYEEEIKYPAGALAYYAFVSFVPLSVLVFAIIGERLALQLYTTTPQFLTVEAQGLMYDAMTEVSGRTGAGVFAIVVLAWGGANIATGFLAVVERIENAAERSLRVQLRDAVTTLVSFSLALTMIVVTSAVFALLPATPLLGVVGSVVLLVVLTGAFLPMYYVPSRAVTSWSGAVPGALTAAVGWSALLLVIHLYAINATRYAIYGVLSGIIIILTSLYVAASMLMVGVIVNAVLAGE